MWFIFLQNTIYAYDIFVEYFQMQQRYTQRCRSNVYCSYIDFKRVHDQEKKLNCKGVGGLNVNN